MILSLWAEDSKEAAARQMMLLKMSLPLHCGWDKMILSSKTSMENQSFQVLCNHASDPWKNHSLQCCQMLLAWTAGTLVKEEHYKISSLPRWIFCSHPLQSICHWGYFSHFASLHRSGTNKITSAVVGFEVFLLRFRLLLSGKGTGLQSASGLSSQCPENPRRWDDALKISIKSYRRKIHLEPSLIEAVT